MSLKLPESFQKRIAQELATLPDQMGKIVLTLEISCGTGSTIHSMKVKRYIEDEMKMNPQT